MSALKEIYSKEFISNLSRALAEVYPSLKAQDFRNDILTKKWSQFELKQRINHIAEVMIVHLPNKFLDKVKVIKQLIKLFRKEGYEDFNFIHIYLPEIIQKSGLSHFKASMDALEYITVFTSAEFAIRQFYLDDFQSTYQQMIHWSKHKNPLVRRLASEGGRPFLPWGIGIPTIKQNPEIHISILENLWNDENESVRRSVANHLNDISKLNEKITWDFAKSKLGHSELTDRDIRHALRTLLKKGNQEILNAFSYNITWRPKLAEIHLSSTQVRIGDRLNFTIRIKNESAMAVKLRLEYKISFLLANGNWHKKVFQLGESILESSETYKRSKSHSFAPITTRTFYPGKHRICLVINGIEYGSKDFTLKR